jgi:[acyl-carrier-protein] S-malonyltransferase
VNLKQKRESSEMIVIVCPGQGSQTPGFLTPWLELPAFKSAIQAMQDASGVDLLKHGTESDADTIRDTSIAQPLIVAAGAATIAALASAGADLSKVAGFAGHSVGEITAAIGAGVLTAEEGIRFVNKRGTEMAKAAALEPTSMAAVLGGEQSVVEARLAELDLQPANYNGGGQIVAAGSVDGIAALQANGPAGSRVIPLQVAGAFHTRYMKPAVEALGEYAAGLRPANPNSKLWTNSDGSVVDSGDDFLKLLVKQVSNPVRWDLCMAAMVDAGVTGIIEVVPGGTLAGLAKRSMPGIEIVAVKSPENLDAALSLINND